MRKSFTYFFAKPYIVNIIIYFLFVCLATFFSIASVLSASNFLTLLFSDSLNQNIVVNPSTLDDSLKNLYTSIIAYGRENALYIFAILIFVVYLLKDIFTYFASFIIASIRNRIIRNIRNELFKKYLSLPLSFINTHKKGDLLSRISNDVIEYDENVLRSILALIGGSITIILYLVILFYIDYQLTLAVFVVFPIVAGLNSLISRSLRKNSKTLQQKSSNLMSIIEQTISGIRIIKSHTAIELVNKRFNNFNSSYTRLRNLIYRRVDLASPISEFMGNIMLIGLLLFGSLRVISDTPTLTPEIFIAYLILFTLIIKPAKDIPTSLFNMKKGRASIDRISEILEYSNPIKEPDYPIEFKSFDKEIRFQRVWFSYNHSLYNDIQKENNNFVLKDINLIIEKGKTTAIVGASGSGKSTLIDLIPKFYLPSEGDILFDDKSINCLHSKDIRNKISIVSQENILFNDTIFNNITFGFSGYGLNDVVSAAKIANIHSFIESLPLGYDTMIGDRGAMLSGGERQRISIARAVLKNSEILILDEATSALDTENERLVQEAINNITSNKTSIIIAHRLSTIVNSDKIIVLDKGEIKEEGTHKELLSLNGIYAKLCKMQEI